MFNTKLVTENVSCKPFYGTKVTAMNNVYTVHTFIASDKIHKRWAQNLAKDMLGLNETEGRSWSENLAWLTPEVCHDDSEVVFILSEIFRTTFNIFRWLLLTIALGGNIIFMTMGTLTFIININFTPWIWLPYTFQQMWLICRTNPLAISTFNLINKNISLPRWLQY